MLPRYAPGGSPDPQAPSRTVAPVVPGQTPYDRLALIAPRYAWWRPLLALAITGVVLVVGQVVVFGIGFAIAAATGAAEVSPDGLMNWITGMLELDAARPLDLAVTLASLGVLIPGVYLGYRLAGMRPVGVVASVALRLRWRWLRVCAVAAVVTIVVSLGMSMGLGLLAGEAIEPRWTPWPTLVVSVLVILALVPFQAAAEEYVFRGQLVQALGSWLPGGRWWSRVLIVLLPTVAFVLGHVYNVWGLLDVGAFALAAMWLTLRTGGLEASIALHVANNVGVFLLLASGVTGATSQEESGGSLIGVLITAITSIGYCWVVDVLARRRGVARFSPWPARGSTAPLAIAQPDPTAVWGTTAALELVAANPVEQFSREYPGRRG